ncbi:MAG: bifunctional DNA-formamidopyrimidine glycosylase/DNA-(apurinic or apyrimidinic site) lyase [Alphaproteobacteria bacterium]|nr:MAG: bifunctional DNA-formamidopyrimidine glycosylase/DNA-(apurinic or apyrimidinic site) lyase [Alphaproteobacteria bacterium]
MPELPEVETVRRGLAPVLEGATIARVELRREGLRWPFPPDMAARLTGRRVRALRRRAKYILADLESGETLLIHLGMSGRMLISGRAPGVFTHQRATPERHDHVIIDTEAGARVTFNDARRFGAMDLFASDAEATHRLLRDLGPEPLGNGFSAAWLSEQLTGRRMPIKAALLDQRIVAGLGNIYVCEALHRARISPQRAAGCIAAPRLERLVAAIREVLSEAIAAGGSSLRDHRQASGEMGYFQHDFRVYGREGAPCPTPGCTGTIRRIVQSGRSSFYCPSCQR